MKQLNGIRRSFLVSLVLPIVLSGCLTDKVEPNAFVAVANTQTSNGAPTISGNPPQVVKVGVTYSFTPSASDPEADTLLFSVANMPNWAEFDQTTGRMSGIPFLGSEGTYPGIEISASDGVTSTALPQFTVTVEPVTAANMPPEIDGTPAASVTIGNDYSFTPSSSDPDGDALTFTAQNVPSWATFSTMNGSLTGTPQTGDEGTYPNVSVSVSDNISTASLPSFTIQVIGLNAAPAISGTPDSQITAGQNYSFVPTASDPDADTLTFSVQNMPAWATFDTGTGALSGTPQAGDVGTFAGIIIDVTDGEQTVALPTFSIDVNATNSPPNISGTPGTQAVVGQNYTFTPTASDPDGDAISFSVQNAPGWLTIDSVTGTLSGAPQAGDVGSAPGIVISVADSTATSSLPAFAINVAPTNTPPVISGTPGNQATVGSRYSFTPTATDADGDTLTFSVQNRPLWLALNSSTGELTGTPQSGDVGNHGQIILSVSDGPSSASLVQFDIDVSAANSAPQISGTPNAQVAAGDSYSFTPTASDADGDSLTFTIQNVPAWASFDQNTGTLSGTTSAGDVGTYNNIQISVTDGDLTTSLPAFSIQVNAVSLGSATLTWTPPTLNTDGSPLIDLDGYVIYYGTAPGSMNTPVPVNNPGLSSFVVGNLPAATYYFTISSVNSVGVESSLSNTAMKTIN